MLPIGTIVMWFGVSEDIPDGWVICDGQFGTPDMNGRFVQGQVDDRDFNTRAGEFQHSHTLTVDSHDHEATTVIPGTGSGPVSMWDVTADGNKVQGTVVTGIADTILNEPPYVTLGFIMRIA